MCCVSGFGNRITGRELQLVVMHTALFHMVTEEGNVNYLIVLGNKVA